MRWRGRTGRLWGFFVNRRRNTIIITCQHASAGMNVHLVLDREERDWLRRRLDEIDKPGPVV